MKPSNLKQPENHQTGKRTKRKKLRLRAYLFLIAVLIIIIGGIYLILPHKAENKQVTSSNKSSLSSYSSHNSYTKSSETKPSTTSDLPDSHQSDWDLVLVNREHIKTEMNPSITNIDGKPVDSRIEEALTNFLTAAQKIDPAEHLISGYRPVAYQTDLYNQYIAQEKAADPDLTQSQAEAKVQTYSQPPGASEHMTGLAVDMSTVDSLNQSDPTVVAQLKKIAPDYGFVLRFPEDGESSTGVDYEDWHWRYVGVDNAKYMTAHNLTLENYLKLLPK